MVLGLDSGPRFVLQSEKYMELTFVKTRHLLSCTKVANDLSITLAVLRTAPVTRYPKKSTNAVITYFFTRLV